MKPPANPLPDTLTTAETLDPHRLEPGMIILADRFCVVGPVAFTAGGWSADVTDLHRQLGATPHHRLRIHHVPIDVADTTKLRLAAALSGAIQPKILHTSSQPTGTLILSRPSTGTPLRAPLTEDVATAVAAVLTDLLVRLHAAGVVGVDFSGSTLNLSGVTPCLVGFDHLLPEGTPQDDVIRLTAFLREHLPSSPALSPTPRSAAALLVALQNLTGPTVQHHLADLLPTTPPMVGRDAARATLLRAVQDAGEGRPSVLTVYGAPGLGKTTLLEHLRRDLRQSGHALVGLGSSGGETPPHLAGVYGAIDDLVRAALQSDPALQASLTQRLQERADPSHPAPRQLWDLAHPSAPPSHLSLDGRRIAHATALAHVVGAMGTPELPVVLLLDAEDGLDTVSRDIVDELSQHFSADHHTLIVVATSAPHGVPGDGRLTLPPLDLHQIERLLAGVLPGDVRDGRPLAVALWRATSGVPLRLWATLQEWLAEGILTYDADAQGWTLTHVSPLTGELPQLFRRHLPRLSLDARRIALLLAIHRGDADRHWVQAVTGWSASRSNAGVSALLRDGLAIDQETHLRLIHPSVREMLLTRIPNRVQRAAHQDLRAWVVQTNADDVVAQARHSELAARPGANDAIALEHLHAANALISHHRLRDVPWHLDAATQRASDPALCITLRERQADHAALTGDAEAMVAAVLEVIHADPSPDRAVEMAARTTAALARAGAVDDAEALALHALALAGEPAPTTRMGTAWAIITTVLGWWTAARPSTARRGALVRLYNTLSHTLSSPPGEHLLRALRTVRHSAGLRTRDAATGYAFAAISVTERAPSLGGRLRLLADTLASEAGEPHALQAVHFSHAHAALGRCDDVAASTRLRRSAEVGGPRHLTPWSGAAHLLVALAELDVSDLPTLQEHLAFARRLAIQYGDLPTQLVARAIGVWLSAVSESPDAGALAESLAADLHQQPDVPLLSRAFLARALLHSGDTHGARAQLPFLTDRAPRRRVTAPPRQRIRAEVSVAVCDVLASQPNLTRRERRLLRRHLAALRRAGRANAKFHASWTLMSARRLATTGEQTRATSLLRPLTAPTPSRTAPWTAWAAHQHLAHLVAGMNPTLARGHEEKAAALADRLGATAAPTRDATPQPKHPRTAFPGVRGPTPLADALGVLENALEDALPPGIALTLSVAEGVTLDVSVDRLQLFTVNLVFAARDILETVGTIDVSCHPDPKEAPDGTTLVLCVTATRPDWQATAPSSGIRVCEEIARSLDSALTLTPDGDTLVMRCAIPNGATGASPTSSLSEHLAIQARIVGVDVRLAETIARALDAEGVIAEIMSGAPQRDEPGAYLIAADQADALARLGVDPNRIVTLSGHDDAVPVSGLVLRVPFSLNALQRVAAAIQEITRPRQ